MHELQPAYLAGKGSVQVHRHCPPRAGVGPPPHHGPVAPTQPDSTAWPVLWARCWMWIRTWSVPPRWSPREWCDQARALGEATACGALRDFNPHRLVPLDAFLYSRVVEAVWTRYRQEWAYGRRTRPGEAIPDRPAPERPGPDADTLARLEAALGSLAELDRCGGRWGRRENSTGTSPAIFDTGRLRFRSRLHSFRNRDSIWRIAGGRVLRDTVSGSEELSMVSPELLVM